MKLGLYLATQWPPEADLSLEIGHLVAQVHAAKANGFSSVWVGQHYLTGPLQMLQAGPLLARLAAEANGMTLGSAVLLLSMLNPVVVAEEAASLDWIAGGATVLGLGMGYRREEFEALGVAFEDRVGRFTEGIELIRRLWREERVHHQGRYFKLDGLSASIRPRQPGGPPIWAAGEVPSAVRRAARLGDAWLPPPVPDLAKLKELFAIYAEARAEAGLAPPACQPLIRECSIGATRQAALAAASGPLLYKYQSYAAWGQADAGAGASADNFEAFMADRFIVGDEAEVADELQRYGEVLGVDTMLLRLQWPGLAQAPVIEAIERIGRVAARLG